MAGINAGAAVGVTTPAAVGGTPPKAETEPKEVEAAQLAAAPADGKALGVSAGRELGLVEGATLERARVSALLARFGARNLVFAVAQIEVGATEEQALVAWARLDLAKPEGAAVAGQAPAVGVAPLVTEPSQKEQEH